MDTQEYLGFVAILESARSSIDTALRDTPSASALIALRLTQVITDLDNAIWAYREKSNTPKP